MSIDFEEKIFEFKCWLEFGLWHPWRMKLIKFIACDDQVLVNVDIIGHVDNCICALINSTIKENERKPMVKSVEANKANIHYYTLVEQIKVFMSNADILNYEIVEHGKHTIILKVNEQDQSCANGVIEKIKPDIPEYKTITLEIIDKGIDMQKQPIASTINQNITPQRLKGLAEAMGKITFIEGDGCYNTNRGDTLDFPYQPHKDWNQCGEVYEWFLNQGDMCSTYLNYEDDGLFTTAYIDFEKYGLLVNKMALVKEAIVLAALTYVEMECEHEH